MRRKIISLNTPIARSKAESLYPWMWDGLVGSSSMIEGGGLKAFDWSGRGSHGTLEGGTTWGHGLAGSALSFDGVNDYVDIESVSLLSSGSSFSVWFRSTFTSTLGSSGIIAGLTGSPNVYIYAQTTSEIWVQPSSGTVKVFVVPTMSSGTWYYLVVIRSGGTTRVFLNGVESASGAQAQAVTLVIDQFGRYTSGTSGFWFQGELDDARTYNRALSAREVSESFRLGPKSLLNRVSTPKLFVMSGNRRRRLLLGA